MVCCGRPARGAIFRAPMISRHPLRGEPRPGRSCPLAFRYRLAELGRPPEWDTDVLLAAGGLYGKSGALESVPEMADAEAAG